MIRNCQWNTLVYSYCVCVKRTTLCNCLCSSPSSRFSANRVRNVGTSHIQDFGACHNVESHVFCYTSAFCRQKTDSPILKNNSKHQARDILRKNLFLILCSAVQNLRKLSILSLLITNYSSAYLSIYLFILSIFLINHPGS